MYMFTEKKVKHIVIFSLALSLIFLNLYKLIHFDWIYKELCLVIFLEVYVIYTYGGISQRRKFLNSSYLKVLMILNSSE